MHLQHYYLLLAELKLLASVKKKLMDLVHLKDNLFILGSQETVDVFNAIDAAWAARDYEAMKSLINDGGNFTFENGTVVTTAQEFVDFVEQDYQQTIADGGEWGWNTDYAFAAYVAGSDDPEAWNQAGEWVNAQFTSSNGVYIEWYHIADGKLQNWNQTKAALPQE